MYEDYASHLHCLQLRSLSHKSYSRFRISWMDCVQCRPRPGSQRFEAPAEDSRSRCRRCPDLIGLLVFLRTSALLFHVIPLHSLPYLLLARGDYSQQRLALPASKISDYVVLTAIYCVVPCRACGRCSFEYGGRSSRILYVCTCWIDYLPRLATLIAPSGA